MTDVEHVTQLIAAYALGSLDEAETARVEAHLPVCATCREELEAYQDVLAALPYGLPQVAPPARVKESLMQRVQPSARSGPVAQRQVSWRESLAQFFRGAAPVWGVASLLLVLVLAGSNLLLWRQVQQLSSPQATASMRVINLNGTDSAPHSTGLIVVSDDGDSGTLVVDHLPALDAGKQYQLWLIQDGKRTSGGVFSVDPAGYGSLWVSSPRPLLDYSGFGITIEPAGGSPGPTGEKVMGGTL